MSEHERFDGDDEEEVVSLYGEINAVETVIAGDDALDGLKRQGETDDAAPSSQGGLHRSIADAYSEFGGELSPFQGVRRSALFPENEDFSDEHSHSEDTGAAVKKALPRSRTFGWISIIIGVASLFFSPGVMGPAAVIAGTAAWVRGSRGLGIGAAVLGVLSMLTYFYLIPAYS